MEWAYVQIASLVTIVMFILYIAISDYRLNHETDSQDS